jgi:hypothetical protein
MDSRSFSSDTLTRLEFFILLGEKTPSQTELDDYGQIYVVLADTNYAFGMQLTLKIRILVTVYNSKKTYESCVGTTFLVCAVPECMRYLGLG